jgi:hypothetical protein
MTGGYPTADGITWHEGEAGSPVAVVWLPARGRPPQAAARRAGLESFCRGSSHDASSDAEGSKAAELVSAQSVQAVANSGTLANLWQATLSGSPGEALWLVELRGFEPLTSCMPSRDPHHGAHHEALRSRALHQSSRAGA